MKVVELPLESFFETMFSEEMLRNCMENGFRYKYV